MNVFERKVNLNAEYIKIEYDFLYFFICCDTASILCKYDSACRFAFHSKALVMQIDFCCV